MISDRFFLLTSPTFMRMARKRGKRRAEEFAATPPPEGSVIFLGDSITEAGPWNELFPELSCVNRGTAFETTVDVLDRMDSALGASPAAISLLIGTNDLHGPKDKRDLASIAARTDEIVAQIRGSAPDALVVINSVMPRTALTATSITELNHRYRAVAEKRGAVYLDLWPALSDGSGNLIKAYTRDNLHLNRAGYEVWAGVLRPELARLAPDHS